MLFSKMVELLDSVKETYYLLHYLSDTQPEEVYYYNGTVECKAKWDTTKQWNLTAVPLDRQKPAAITKQKADAEKKVQNRNAKRAAEKGIPEPPK